MGTFDDTEVPLINGERVNTRCALQGNENLVTEIVRIGLEDNPDPECPCSLALVSGARCSSDDNAIYETKGNDPCCLLSNGSKFSFAYSAEARIEGHPTVSSGSYIFPLGVVAIEWLPPSLKIP